MRLLGVVAAAAVLAQPVWAKPDPHLVTLQRQVAALQQQVDALRQQLTVEKNWRVCQYALTQDSFRLAVFPALDEFAKYLTGQPVPAWEQIPRYDDDGACAAVGVTRPAG